MLDCLSSRQCNNLRPIRDLHHICSKLNKNVVVFNNNNELFVFSICFDVETGVYSMEKSLSKTHFGWMILPSILNFMQHCSACLPSQAGGAYEFVDAGKTRPQVLKSCNLGVTLLTNPIEGADANCIF